MHLTLTETVFGTNHYSHATDQTTEAQFKVFSTLVGKEEWGFEAMPEPLTYHLSVLLPKVCL